MSKEMQDLFYELKQYLVQHSPKWDTLCDIEQYIIDLEKENERLNNILIEFENWLVETYYLYIPDIAEISGIRKIYDKLQELKGD